jgi:hypothetical protein
MRLPECYVMRRTRHCLLALVVVSVPAITAAATEIGASEIRPIKAHVTSPGAAVRSGPGDSYYLTDSLPQDTVVEVYRRQPDGWCAIRPPADSFSWVFAQNVQTIGDGLAEISKPDVAARVGSRMSSQRDVVQVRLHQGEQVAILGSDEREANSGERGLWYKIAPPAGEFRWVRASDIGLASETSEPVAPLSSADVESRVTTAALEEPIGGSSAGITAPPLASAKSAPRPASPSSDNWSAARSAAPLPDITPIGAGSATTANLAQQLGDLELRLSRMVAESPATWNIAPLEQAAESLLSQADSVADREAVKVTLAKIDRFAAIQRRHAAANPPASPAATSQLAADGAGSIAGPAVTSQTTAPYDAVGTLRPVVSRRPGAPQFALVNPQGQVVTFVTPSPDVNLQPYVGQRIGVTGSRGYIPEFRRAHVTAGRVVPLQERILR